MSQASPRQRRPGAAGGSASTASSGAAALEHCSDSDSDIGGSCAGEQTQRRRGCRCCVAYVVRHVSLRSIAASIVLGGIILAQETSATAAWVLSVEVGGNTLGNYLWAAFTMSVLHISFYIGLHSLFNALRAVAARQQLQQQQQQQQQQQRRRRLQQTPGATTAAAPGTSGNGASNTDSGSRLSRPFEVLHLMLAVLKNETRPAKSAGFSLQHAATLYIAGFIATRGLVLPPRLNTAADNVFVVTAVARAGSVLWQLIAVFLTEVFQESRWAHEHGLDGQRGAFLISYLRPAFWVVLAFTTAENCGVNLGATLTGLGVGGVMLALSAQEVAKDAFASVTMMVEGAFEKDDVIAVAGSEDKIGRVSHITPKHTILECVDGERLVIANRDIANARIRNFGSGVAARRRLFAHIPVSRDTPLAELEALPGRVQEAVAALPQTQFANFWLKSFGDWALHYELVFFLVDHPDFRAGHHAVHMAVLRVLDETKGAPAASGALAARSDPPRHGAAWLGAREAVAGTGSVGDGAPPAAGQ